MEYGKWQNGIGLSRKVQNAFDDLQNVNVFDDIGSLLCRKSPNKASGNTITAGCYRAVVPTGDVYFFSKTDGKVWKRAISNGAYSLVHTGVNGAFKGATYYRNYLYYTMDGFLGRYDFGSVAGSPSTSLSTSTSISSSRSSSLSTSTSVSASTSTSLSVSASASSTPSSSPSVSPSSGTPSWNDNFQVLNSGYPHPLFQFDLILYIGNGYNVASLDDAGVFSSSVLDQNVEDIIYAMTNLGDDLLTLSNPGSYINDSSITRWNTFSDSWSYKDSIKQKGAYAFLDSDNYVHVVCESGDVYLYNGSQLEIFSNIRNAASTTGHQLTTNFQGRPLIANGGRVYALHRKNRNFDFALVGEYTCSAGADATIHSICAVGSQLLISWEYNGTFGIDELGNNFANARVTTPRFKKASTVKVFYDDLQGASIGIYSRLDGENNWSAHEVVDDSDDERCVKTVDSMQMKSGGQAMIVITPNVSNITDSPSIDSISVE